MAQELFGIAAGVHVEFILRIAVKALATLLTAPFHLEGLPAALAHVVGKGDGVLLIAAHISATCWTGVVVLLLVVVQSLLLQVLQAAVIHSEMVS